MDSIDGGVYVLSNILGISSIALWLVALLPQAYVNWRHKSAEGLSIYFLLLWLIGDSMNLVGCVILEQRLFQKFLSAYYILLDIVLLAQFALYKQAKPKSSQLSIASPVRILSGNECNRPLVSKSSQVQIATTAEYHSFNIYSTPRTPKRRSWLVRVLTYLGIAAVVAFGFVCCFKWYPTSSAVIYKKVGLYLAWGSSIVYHLSRLPQLWHSYKRQSVEGLSKAMFLVILCANGLYVASLSCLVQVIDHANLVQTIPFIYGALMSFVLDLFVVAQFFVYNCRSKVSGSVQHIV